MRLILLFLVVILAVSGAALLYAPHFLPQVILWVHLTSGFFFAVVFAIFSIEHIHFHRNSIARITICLLCGVLSVGGGAVSIFSGVVLFLYAPAPFPLWEQVHSWSSLLFVVAGVAHYSTRDWH